jgi:hypothetical protein
MTAPRVSAVVVSFNTREHLLRCVASLEAHAALPVEVIVVDNGSHDGSVAALRGAHPAVRVVGANPDSRRLQPRPARGPRAVLPAPQEATPRSARARSRPGRGARQAAGRLYRRPAWTVGPDGGPRSLLRPRPHAPCPDGGGAAWWSRCARAGPRRCAGQRRSRPASRSRCGSQPPASPRARFALGDGPGLDERFLLYEEDVDLCLRGGARAGASSPHAPRAVVRQPPGQEHGDGPAVARLGTTRATCATRSTRGPAARPATRLPHRIGGGRLFPGCRWDGQAAGD